MKRQWCIGTITGEYLARMEDVLAIYNLAFNEKRPVVCFDELPVQLLGEIVAPLLMKKTSQSALIMNTSEQGQQFYW